MLDKLTSSDFAPYLTQTFHIHLDREQRLEVELVNVTEYGAAAQTNKQNGKRRPFSVIFRGPHNVYLPQQIYTIEHEQLGPLSLFLVPIGPDVQGMCFEAIFS